MLTSIGTFRKGDDCRGEVVQCHEAAFELLVAHEQLAEGIEPAMTNLDNPAPRLFPGLASFCDRFPAAIDDVRNVAVCLD